MNARKRDLQRYAGTELDLKISKEYAHDSGYLARALSEATLNLKNLLIVLEDDGYFDEKPKSGYESMEDNCNCSNRIPDLED